MSSGTGDTKSADSQHPESAGGASGAGSGSANASDDDGPSASPSAQTCTVGGQTFAVGDHFPDTLGCNTCWCRANGDTSMCTAVACPNENPPCTYQGVTHAGGEYFPAGDGCNICVCSVWDGPSSDPYKYLPEKNVMCSKRTC